MLDDTQLLTIAVASVPSTVAVVIGILVNDAGLRTFRRHLDVRFDEMMDRWRLQDLKRY